MIILAVISVFIIAKGVLYTDRKKALEIMDKRQDETILWLIKNNSSLVNNIIPPNVQLIGTSKFTCWVITKKIFFYESGGQIYAGKCCIFDKYFDSWKINEDHVEIIVRNYIIRIPFQKEWEGFELYILNQGKD